MHTATPHPSNRRGFTLIELLVVIGIILILIGITFAVGRSVVGDAKKRTTEDTIRVLDAALQAYIQGTGENPPFLVEFVDAANPNTRNTLIALDGNYMDGNAPIAINSVGVFLTLAQQNSEAKAILDKLSTKQLVQLDTDGAGEQPTLLTALDAWGRPIRFVHPKGDGLILGQVNRPVTSNLDNRPLQDWLDPQNARPPFLYPDARRNNYNADSSGDGDGGKAAGSRPYFYSAGEDGLVGWGQRDGVWVNYNLDNVYLSEPTFAKPPQ